MAAKKLREWYAYQTLGDNLTSFFPDTTKPGGKLSEVRKCLKIDKASGQLLYRDAKIIKVREVKPKAGRGS